MFYQCFGHPTTAARPAVKKDKPSITFHFLGANMLCFTNHSCIQGENGHARGHPETTLESPRNWPNKKHIFLLCFTNVFFDPPLLAPPGRPFFRGLGRPARLGQGLSKKTNTPSLSTFLVQTCDVLPMILSAGAKNGHARDPPETILKLGYYGLGFGDGSRPPQ